MLFFKPSKRDVAKEVLRDYGYMYVHFDSSHHLCVLPKELRGASHQVLGMGSAGSRYAVIDLRMEEFGITGTIQPGKKGIIKFPVWVSIPWAAVFAITNATGSKTGGRTWPEDMPKTVRARTAMHALNGGRAGSGHPTGKLRLVS